MLKKTTLLFALLALNTKIIIAQTLSVGPMVGLNISTLDAAPNTKALYGLSVGGFTNYSINTKVGLSAKILYSQLGTDFTIDSDFLRLHYLQIPLTVVYYFGKEGDKCRPKVFAGPYLGAKLKANYDSGNEVVGQDGNEVYQNIDIGGLVGAGFNYRIQPRTWLNVDAGFSRGFTNITNSVATNYHNVAFALNIGISFPVGK